MAAIVKTNVDFFNGAFVSISDLFPAALFDGSPVL